MCECARDNRFQELQSPNRVWAISSVHGELDRLLGLHDALLERLEPGDRLVYLGNYTGYGSNSREVIDELLTFRRLAMSIPSVMPHDIVYLRGEQEEMWHTLTQLQFAQHPVDTLLEMLGSGMNNTLQSYGISTHDGIVAAREGVMSLTKWTSHVRDILRVCAGHDVFMSHLKRAAYTTYEGRTPILFVNAGIDTSKPLADQEDCLWRGGTPFEAMNENYSPFEKVIRGFDPAHQGVKMNCVTASIDGGCGFGGSLVCAGMTPEGEIFELMEA